MPLFIGDYLADTMRLTRDQHGGYLLLIMDYWRSGEAPPDDDDILATITKSTPSEWKKLRAILAKFFTIEDGLWKHKRIEIEMQKAAENYASKVERAKAGAAARWGKNAPSNAQASDKQCSSNANHNHTPTEKNPSGSSSDRRAKGNARAPRGAAPPSPVSDWADEIPQWAAFKASIGSVEWAAWFQGSHPNGSITTLVTPSEFSRQQIAARYGSKLEALFGPALQLKTKGGTQ
jgi:uncharacterized protein YdaU (DUF1376 family)